MGENIEPRVLELLPAIAIKKPAIFMSNDYPEDLKMAISQLKKSETKIEFRNIPLKKCESWLPLVGRKGSFPSITKNFRLHRDDIEKLKSLSQILKIS